MSSRSKKKLQQSRGFTLIELLLVMGIITVIFSITTIVLIGAQRTSAKGSQVDTILTDLRDWQTKAMVQNTGGGVASYDFGVYLQSSSYTLFRGSVYDPADTSNFVVDVDPSLSISGITFPASTILFEGGSGEVVGFSLGTDSFDIDDLAGGASVTVTFNQYGIPLE